MEIAKKYAFELETKTVKPLKDKSFTCYNTDTIKLEIEVMEESDYKCLDEFETKVEVIYSYPNGEVDSPIKQTMEEGGIEIIPDSIITIVPAKGCLFPTEYLRIDINIYNEEEFISLRPFIFKVYKSTEGELVDGSDEVLQSMYDIKKEISSLSEKLIELNDNVTNTITQIDEYIEENTSNMIENIKEENIPLMVNDETKELNPQGRQAIKQLVEKYQDQNNFNKIAEIQKDVDEIKVQMKENIKKQVDSMEDVNKLEEKSANLKMQTADYANNANTLKKVTWWQNCKLTIIIAVIIIAIVLAIVLPIVLKD